jgi:OOP family OmpA-OmpF porin
MNIKAPLFLLFIISVLSSFCQQHNYVTIYGVVRNDKTLQPMKGIDVSLTGSDGSVYHTKTDTGGHYMFDSTKIKLDAKYQISVDVQDQRFLQSKVKPTVSTEGLTSSKKIREDFVLQEKPIRDLYYPIVSFGFNSDFVTQGAKDTVLEYLVKLYNDNPTLVIQLDAHASPDEGTSDQKMKLSEARAKACKNYLVSQGIDSARIVTKGWSDTQTLPGCNKQDIKRMKTKTEKIKAEEMDRRVEFRVLNLKYKAK